MDRNEVARRRNRRNRTRIIPDLRFVGVVIGIEEQERLNAPQELLLFGQGRAGRRGHRIFRVVRRSLTHNADHVSRAPFEQWSIVGC